MTVGVLTTVVVTARVLMTELSVGAPAVAALVVVRGFVLGRNSRVCCSGPGEGQVGRWMSGMQSVSQGICGGRKRRFLP